MKHKHLFEEVAAECDYQESKWGTEADDTKNSPNDWVAYIAAYSTKWFAGGFVPYKQMTVDKFRAMMIKVAAIAISAVASIDRQRKANGTTFYEE